MSGHALKIAVISESRADYGILYPLLKALQSDKRFELDLLVTGMHLERDFGETYRDIEADGLEVHTFTTDSLYWQCMGDNPQRPDFLVVLGDRRRMLEATIQFAYWNIPVCHIQGGDRTGTIDDPTRHAITRFAHLHFPCTPQSARRLKRMGEEPWRIQIVGPLGIYAMPEAQFISKEKLCAELGLDASKEIVLVIQHPVSTQVKEVGKQMRQTLEAVKGWQTIVVYPNTDTGSADMVKVIEGCDWIHKFKSLPYLKFVSLLKVSDVIVGNSSCGLYEAPLFGVPAVNIGIRQANREHGSNAMNVEHKMRGIKAATSIQLEWGKGGPKPYTNPFKIHVDGIKVILDTLASTPRDERLLQKCLTY